MRYKWLSKQRLGSYIEWDYFDLMVNKVIYSISRADVGSNSWRVSIDGTQYNSERADFLKRLVEKKQYERGQRGRKDRKSVPS